MLSPVGFCPERLLLLVQVQDVQAPGAFPQEPAEWNGMVRYSVGGAKRAATPHHGFEFANHLIAEV